MVTITFDSRKPLSGSRKFFDLHEHEIIWLTFRSCLFIKAFSHYITSAFNIKQDKILSMGG
uniref:Uncharacterized protein n=1 Tax=Tetranychus urticae TaxID=32264 RepID=T1KSV2_TETUR